MNTGDLYNRSEYRLSLLFVVRTSECKSIYLYNRSEYRLIKIVSVCRIRIAIECTYLSLLFVVRTSERKRDQENNYDCAGTPTCQTRSSMPYVNTPPQRAKHVQSTKNAQHSSEFLEKRFGKWFGE